MRACTTWDDSERLPENRRSGTAIYAHALQRLHLGACCSTVATVMAATQPTDKGVTASRAGVAGAGRPPAFVVKLPCRFTINGDYYLDPV